MGWYQFPENYFPDNFPRQFLGYIYIGIFVIHQIEHQKARKPPEHQNTTRTRSSSRYAGPRTSDLALRPSGGSQGSFPDRGPVRGTRPRQPLLWWEGVQTSERLNYVERLRWVILGKGGD